MTLAAQLHITIPFQADLRECERQMLELLDILPPPFSKVKTFQSWLPHTTFGYSLFVFGINQQSADRLPGTARNIEHFINLHVILLRGAYEISVSFKFQYSHCQIEHKLASFEQVTMTLQVVPAKFCV